MGKELISDQSQSQEEEKQKPVRISRKKKATTQNLKSYKQNLLKIWDTHIKLSKRLNILKYFDITRQKTQQMNADLKLQNSHFQIAFTQGENRCSKQREAVKKSLRLQICRTILNVLGPKKYKEKIKKVTSVTKLISIVMQEIIQKVLVGSRTKFQKLTSLLKISSDLKNQKLKKKLAKWLAKQQKKKKKVSCLALNSRLSFMFLLAQQIKYRCQIALSFCHLLKNIKQKPQFSLNGLYLKDRSLNQIFQDLAQCLANQDKLNDKLAKIIILHGSFQSSVIKNLISLSASNEKFVDIFNKNLSKLTHMTDQKQYERANNQSEIEQSVLNEKQQQLNIFDVLTLEDSQTFQDQKNKETFLKIYHKYGLIDQHEYNY